MSYSPGSGKESDTTERLTLFSLWSCNHHYSQDMGWSGHHPSPHPPPPNFILLLAVSLPQFQPLVTTNVSVVPIVLLFPGCHIKRIIECVSLETSFLHSK